MPKKRNKTTEIFFKHLDQVRDSGTTNMFGAAPGLEFHFALDKYEARKVLKAWMDTFGKGTLEERARIAGDLI